MRKVCVGDIYLTSQGEKITVVGTDLSVKHCEHMNLVFLDKPTTVFCNGVNTKVDFAVLGEDFFNSCELISSGEHE